MATRELKSVDISSYTIISTGISTLISLLISIVITGFLALTVPNSFQVIIYVVPTIIFGTMICSIFLYFSQAYLYNLLSKKLGFIKFDIEGEYIHKISTKETAIIIGSITLIIVLVVYLAISLITPLFLSSLITILMYASQVAVASMVYQLMFLTSNLLYIAIGIITSVIMVFVFTLLGTYVYNVLGDSERGILVKLSKEDKYTQLDSITPTNFAIAFGAIILILNLVIAIIAIISGVQIFNALASVLLSFFVAFIGAFIIALGYNFLAPKLGKLKFELD